VLKYQYRSSRNADHQTIDYRLHFRFRISPREFDIFTFSSYHFYTNCYCHLQRRTLKQRSIFLHVSLFPQPLYFFGLLLSISMYGANAAEIIDRKALVTRHNPILHEVDYTSPFTVGNGGFAFTADITGLQTYPDEYYSNGTPLEILSDWCWHSFPNISNYTLADASREYLVNGKPVAFPTEQNTPAGKWLRENPHRFPLGQIGFKFKGKNASIVRIEELRNISQVLDLWSGSLKSNFTIEGTPVHVGTVCHPELDLIAVEVQSALIQSGQISVVIRFPYGYSPGVKNKPAQNWSNPDRHRTSIVERQPNRFILKRTADATEYYVSINWVGECRLREQGPHHYVLTPSRTKPLMQFSILFGNRFSRTALPMIEKTREASGREWESYWMRGGAIDFSQCTDPRASELERRIILSRYLTRAQSCGTVPPQESGLTCSSWYGKHHTEMIWWHTAHFALWNHPELLAKNLEWYAAHVPGARQTAKERGLEGARWSKMVGPGGRESPGNNPFIIWNQPHPIYLAELLYRAKSDTEALEKWKALVLESASCMASMAVRDTVRHRYVLGPPLWHAQETYDPLVSQNPTFELAYWSFGLRVAQTWLERAGRQRNALWDRVVQYLSPLPVQNGLYVGLESSPTTFDAPDNERDHPSMLMAFGFLPGASVDTSAMRRTLHRVIQTWQWDEKIWGWDYPMAAMTAARLGEPETALSVLLKDAPHNHYAANGHCAQTPDLPVYLPANGALLAAIALMTAGWDGNDQETPCFPRNGKWKITYENLKKLP
jgi:hypothetical protein